MQLTGPPSDDFANDATGLCQECKREPAVGPCAACELMICGNCGVLSNDTVGTRVICMSCAAIIAEVRDRKPERRPLSLPAAAVIALAVLTALALSLL